MLVDEVDVSTTPEVVTQLPGLVLVLLVSWLWKKRRGLMTFYLKLCDGVVCSKSWEMSFFFSLSANLNFLLRLQSVQPVFCGLRDKEC